MLFRSESGVKNACYMVYGMAELDPEKKGMSTTLSAMLIRGNLAFAAHVGDSRVYRVRGDAVRDHVETPRIIAEERVLVDLALPSDIGPGHR